MSETQPYLPQGKPIINPSKPTPASPCACEPKAPKVPADEPQIAETDLWLNFACAALTGLLARNNTQFTQAQLSASAGEYADKMVDQYRKRHA